jgi:hypothetical protein
MLALQFEILVAEQLDKSGVKVTEQLQLLLLSVAEEQADGSVVYSDAIVDAGVCLFYCLEIPSVVLC